MKSKPVYTMNIRNLCKDCRWAKDHFGESCFCVHYGIIVTYGKEKCKGHGKVRQQEDNG